MRYNAFVVSSPYEVPCGPDSTGAERVILVPPEREVSTALAGLRALLDTPGEPLRVIGTGATVRRTWPAWLSGIRRRVTLCEIDAYLPDKRGEVLAEIVPQMEAWLDRVFEGTLGELRPAPVFWSALCHRYFDALTEAWLIAAGVDARHPDAPIDCVDRGWAGYRFLHARRAARSSPLALPPPVRRRRLSVAGAVGAATVLAIAQRIREFVAEAPSRARLQQMRASEHGVSPRLWVGIDADSPRASRAVLDTVPAAAGALGESLGVLILDSLRTGRAENEFDHTTEPVLPVLDAPPLRSASAVDQAISVESWRSLGRVLLSAIRTTVRATWRSSEPPVFGAAGTAVPLSLSAAAKMLSIDVVRAVEAAAASGTFLSRRHPTAGTRVVYAHATSVNDAVTVQSLGRAGPTTIELCHGITEARWQQSCSRTATSVKALWSRSEAETIAPLLPGQRCVGGFYPRPQPPTLTRTPLRPGERAIVLVASSYLPRAWGSSPRLREHFQQPLLDEVLAALAIGLPLDLWWRPHPGDDPQLVDALLAAHPQLKRSVAPAIEDELTRCHVLVTSLSSVMIEGLFFGVPVFVHEVPGWDPSAFEAFDPQRRFGVRASFVELLKPCLKQLASSGDALLEPERAARRRMFGPGGEPASLVDLLAPAPLPVRSNQAGSR